MELRAELNVESLSSAYAQAYHVGGNVLQSSSVMAPGAGKRIYVTLSVYSDLFSKLPNRTRYHQSSSGPNSQQWFK